VADVIGAASLLVSEAALPSWSRGQRADSDASGASEEWRRNGRTQVIIRPVVSEKSYVLAEAGKYTFRVHDKAHKTQIRQAIELLFDVKVVEVRTARSRASPSAAVRPRAARRQWKKAIVQVARATRSRSSKGWKGR
jgi:large subunit ribosomal protein L23